MSLVKSQENSLPSTPCVFATETPPGRKIIMEMATVSQKQIKGGGHHYSNLADWFGRVSGRQQTKHLAQSLTHGQHEINVNWCIIYVNWL